MGVRVSVSGSFNNTQTALRRLQRREYLRGLGEKYGPMGVEALKRATPKEHGDTAEGWYYEVVDRPGYYSIHWMNSHYDRDHDIPVAVLIQYGHATGTGGRVEGIDFINPALRPIFDQIAADMWKEVTK